MSMTDEEKKELKRKNKPGCLFKTCLSFMVFSLIILVGGISIGWHFGDKYLKKNFDVSLKEAFRIVGDFKDYRSAKKALNQIEEGSPQGFVDSLSSAIFIKDGTLSVDEVQELLSEMILDSFNKDSKDENNAQDDDINKYLEKLSDLFSAENFDKDRIIDYDGEDYYIAIHGSDLTAFLNDIILNKVLDNADVKDKLNDSLNDNNKIELDSFDFKDVLFIRQIAFYKNADNQTGVTLTTQTNFKKLIESGIKNLNTKNLDIPVDGFAESLTNLGISFSGWFIKSFILPKELYITIDMPLSAAVPAKIKLNNTDQKDWDTVKKITKGVETSPLETFDNMFLEDGNIGRAIVDINKKTPFISMIENSAKGGVVKCDFIDLIIDFSGINYHKEQVLDNDGNPVLDNDGNQKYENKRYEEEDCITSKDLLYSAKYLVSSDTDKAMFNEGKIQKDYTRYTFKKDNDNNYVFENGLPVLDENGFDDLREGALLDSEVQEIRKEYEKLFIEALSKSYGLIDGIEFDNLFDMLSASGNTDLNSVFDSQKIREHLSGTNEEGGAVITDKMLAAIVAMRMDKFIGNQSQKLDLNAVTPRYVVLGKQEIDGTVHNLVDIGIEIKLSDILNSLPGDMGTFGAIFSAITPQSILICAKIDVTLNLEDDQYLPIQLSIDRFDYDSPDMARILKTFNRFKVFGNDSMDKFIREMLSPVKDILKKMNDTMPGLSLEESQINLPDATELIVSMLNQTMNTQITRTELEENMQFILNKIEVPAYSVDDGLSDYLNWVYAMASETSITDLLDTFSKTEDEILDVFDTNKLIKMSDNNSDYYSDKIVEFDLDNYNGINSYDAIINAARLGQLILDFAQKDDKIKDYLNQDTLKHVEFIREDTKDYIKITLQLDAVILLGGGEVSSSTQFFADVIGEILMTAMIDISDGEKQNRVMLNGDEEGTDNLIGFIKKLGINIDDIKNDVMSALEENVVEMLDKINDLGIVEFKLSSSGDALVLTNAFDIMSNILNADKDPAEHINGTEIQSVLYGIYKPEIDQENGLTIFAQNNPILQNETNLQEIMADRFGTPTSPDSTFVTFADYELGRLMSEKTQDIGEIVSLNIINLDDNGTNAERERAWIDEFSYSVDRNYNYIAAIFKIDLHGENGFLGETPGNKVAEKLLPQFVYGTLLLKENHSGAYELEWFRVNEMDIETQKVLYKIAGETEENITSTVDGYFNSSSGGLDTIIKSEMQQAVADCSNHIYSVSMDVDASYFDGGLSLPLGNTSVGSYKVKIDVELI